MLCSGYFFFILFFRVVEIGGRKVLVWFRFIDGLVGLIWNVESKFFFYLESDFFFVNF